MLWYTPKPCAMWRRVALLALLTSLFTLFTLFDSSVAQAQSVSDYSLISPPGIIDFSGGSAIEMSGVTYSGETNTLFIANDSLNDGNVFEYELNGQFKRKITNNISGLADLEGISWMYDDRFVITSEDSGKLFIVDIVNGQSTINSAVYTIDTPVPPDTSNNGGYGLEGVAYDQSSLAGDDQFYIVHEKKNTNDNNNANDQGYVYHLDKDGDVLSEFGIPQSTALDASGIYHSGATQSLFVMSEESNKLLKLSVSGQLLGSRSVSSTFAKPEGITFKPDLSEMIIVGEPRKFARYALPAVDIANPGNQTNDLNEFLTLSLTVTDGSPTTFTQTGLPTGLSINSTTGEIV